MECSLGLIILRKLDFPVSYSQESIEVNRCVQIVVGTLGFYLFLDFIMGRYLSFLMIMFTIFSYTASDIGD